MGTLLPGQPRGSKEPPTGVKVPDGKLYTARMLADGSIEHGYKESE